VSGAPGFRPVVLRGGRQEVAMARCPTEDVLILFASSLPGGDAEELLDGWSAEDITAHLAGCAACRATVEETGSLTAALRADEIDEPPAGLWDEMADEVMRSLEMPSLSQEPRGEVIPLRAAMPEQPVSRRMPWGWAVAAVLVVGLTVGIAVMRRGGEEPAVPVADGAEIGADAALPDRATAEALAAELGISLDTIDPAAVAQAEMLDASASLGDAGVNALVDDLDEDEAEALDVGLGDDLFGMLAELDTEELAALMQSLES
jgi:hypothetical protein